MKLWHVGVPPSGPMDSLHHRLANALVGNPSDAAALEFGLTGPTLRFHCDTVVALAGGLEGGGSALTLTLQGWTGGFREAVFTRTARRCLRMPQHTQVLCSPRAWMAPLCPGMPALL